MNANDQIRAWKDLDATATDPTHPAGSMELLDLRGGQQPVIGTEHFQTIGCCGHTMEYPSTCPGTNC